MIKVTVWNEFHHERNLDRVKELYPNGIHAVIAEFLKCSDISVRTATLDQPECGLTQDVIDDTDVLIWWGHAKHDLVPDEIVKRVRDAVVDRGMGMIFLHSAHKSKPFMSLLGTSGNLKWRCAKEKARVWTVAPSHQIAQGLGEYFEIPHEEMYGEPFVIPQPDELVFISWFQGGEVFRSGCCYHRGNGNIFYFQPGHEEYPNYYIPEVQQVIKNAVRWAAPLKKYESNGCPQIKEPLEKLD